MNPNDIRLLVTGRSAPRPLGAYYPDGLIEFAGGGEDTLRRMTFCHELAHADLNRASHYGQILQSVGVFVRDFPDRSGEERLNGLINAARRTHEVRATWSGLFTGFVENPDALMSVFPDYRCYLDDARKLYGDFRDGCLASNAIVDGIAVAAMNGRSKFESMAAHEIGATASLADFSFDNTPDARLKILLDHAPFDLPDFHRDKFWTDRGLDAVQARPWSEIGPAVHSAVQSVVQMARAVLLRTTGHDTTGLGEHAPDDLAESEQTKHLDPKRYLLSQVPRHRLIYRERPSLRVRAFDHYVEQWMTVPAVVVCARRTDLLLDQYEIDEHSRSALLRNSDQGCSLGIRFSATTGGTTEVVFGLLRGMSDLALLKKSLAVHRKPAIASVATSVAGTAAWATRWLAALADTMYVSMLLDLDPGWVRDIFTHTRSDWSAPHTRVLKVTRPSDGEVFWFAYLRYPELTSKSLLTTVPGLSSDGCCLVAVSTEVGAQALVESWMEDPEVSATTRDDTFVGAALMSDLLERLIEDEPWFDFRSTTAPFRNP